MDQFVVLHFNINKNDRNYQLMVQPGSPFEDIQAVLDQFKVDVAELQETYKQKEAEAKAKAEAETPAVPVEAELVS